MTLYPGGFIKFYGTREQVWEGVAFRTKKGERKCDLVKNKFGKIVSKKFHENGIRIWQKKPLFDLERENERVIKVTLATFFLWSIIFYLLSVYNG